MDTDNFDENTRTHVALTKGTMVASYRIDTKIGAGGMGEVYLAEDTRLNRQVAIKFLPPHLMTNQDVRTRFMREAQAVAKLNHPGIVTIHDVAEFHDRPYFVMEHVEGESLHHFAHDKPLALDLVVEYAIQICQALGEAHRAGIVHRDIKAANIVIDNKGRARLLDFGLAAMEGDEKLTRTGSTLGTVSYMSPEQVSGREIDHRSDLFSLGVVLYELIASRTPFRRDSEGATLSAIIQDQHEPLSRYKSEVPEQLERVVSKLLEKDKELRYQSAEGIIADLKKLVYDSQQSTIGRPAQNQPSSSKLIPIVSVLGIVAAAIALVIWFWPSTDSTSSESETPMIAVLPFENLGSAEDEYFSEGMTEEITSRLAVIDGLGVISRTSSMKYRESDKSLKEIGKELGVGYILEGTVRWSKVGGQSKVRITPQLVRVSDDRHLWADNYERALMEVFAVQADIAEKIVEQLGITLGASEKAQLASRPTENAEAYQLYLKSLNAVRRGEFADFSAKDDLDRAVKLDPNFALAYALRAEVYSGMAFGSPATENATIAYESAQKALELKPGLAAGHLALGMYYNLVETDYDRALEEFAMARSELHNDSDLLRSIAYVLMRQGKFDEAQANLRQVAELDPLNPLAHGFLANALSFTRDFDEAEQSISRSISLEPDRVIGYGFKMQISLARYGDMERIRPIVDEALEHCDSMKFARRSWFLRDHMPDLPWDRWIAASIRQYRDSLEADSSFYREMYWMSDMLNDFDMLRVYADSAQETFKKWYEDNDENPHASSEYGRLLSILGDCERAVELGERGKELLSVDECHF